MRGRAVGMALAGATAGCGALATPAHQQAQASARLGTELAAHLQALPQVVTASVVVRANQDAPRLMPTPTPSCAWRIAAILALTPDADAAAATTAARDQLQAALPDACPPAITTAFQATPAHAPLAKVGPFTVAVASRRPLQLTLAALLLAMAWLLMRLRAQPAQRA